MCGICGIAGNPDSNLVKAMTSKMVHRGPDSDGFFTDNEVALGMRRLKIIDLNTGDQPIHNEDKTVWVIFNGEIYNFKELRSDLIQMGHNFYTQSDTEVIVHLYEEYGDECVDFLFGMFAFCIWDKDQKRILLARDRLGIKPLYYSFKNQQLIFSSEIKPILECQDAGSQMNLTALDYYLTFLYIPAPLTIYEGINKLLPGHILSFQNGKIEIKDYWQLPVEGNKKGEGEDYYVDKIKELLNGIVQQHMISDVPLGALLSGGLDSSCVVGLMSKLVNQPIKTFSIGFGERYASYNELEYSRQIAKLFNCEHHEFILKPDIEKTILKVVDFIEEPFADSSAILNFLICKEARGFVTVALSGIGGDEVFGGYPRYLGAMSAASFQNLPYFLRSGLKNISYFIPESRKSSNIGGRFKRYLSSSTLSLEEKYINWISYFHRADKERLYSEVLRSQLPLNPRYLHLDYFLNSEGEDFPRRVNVLDIHTYLPDDLLIMADRMSMANSLELRVPLCDHRLIEFVSAIPFSLKLKGFKLKSLFKKVLTDLLPQNIINKRKQGFMVPLADWLKDDLKDYVREVLSEQNIRKRKFFNPQEVNILLDSHFRGKAVNTHQIWALFILELWLRKIQD